MTDLFADDSDVPEKTDEDDSSSSDLQGCLFLVTTGLISGHFSALGIDTYVVFRKVVCSTLLLRCLS